MRTDGAEGSSTVGGVVTSLTLDANGQYHFRTDTGQGRSSHSKHSHSSLCNSALVTILTHIFYLMFMVQVAISE